MGAYIVVCPGVAMPHARYEDGVNKVAISFLRLKNPVFFYGKDKEPRPVDMLFAFSTTDAIDHGAAPLLKRNVIEESYIQAIKKIIKKCRTW